MPEEEYIANAYLIQSYLRWSLVWGVQVEDVCQSSEGLSKFKQIFADQIMCCPI